MAGLAVRLLACWIDDLTRAEAIKPVAGNTHQQGAHQRRSLLSSPSPTSFSSGSVDSQLRQQPIAGAQGNTVDHLGSRLHNKAQVCEMSVLANESSTPNRSAAEDLLSRSGCTATSAGTAQVVEVFTCYPGWRALHEGRVDVVCYGIGRFAQSMDACCQLVVLLELVAQLKVSS